MQISLGIFIRITVINLFIYLMFNKKLLFCTFVNIFVLFAHFLLKPILHNFY